jgi:hypothetical protein
MVKKKLKMDFKEELTSILTSPLGVDEPLQKWFPLVLCHVIHPTFLSISY